MGYDLPLTSPFYSRSGARFLRGVLSETCGCHDEAARWFGSFAETSVYDLAYLAPALVRRGASLERLGRTEAAVECYRRALALWEDCDDQLAPVLRPAEERLAALGFGAKTNPSPVRPPGFNPSPDVPIGA